MEDKPGDRQRDPQPEPPGGWLPPEPPGGLPPPPPAPPPPPRYQPPSPPQPSQQFPPPAPPPQQPQYPYPYPPQQPGYPPQGWQPLPPQPPNNDAVVGFTCAVIGAALLFFTAGLSTIISLVLGIVAIPYSRKGKRKIASGETKKHKDLAGSGFVIGIIVVVLSILATIAWALIFALVDWDEVGEDLEDESERESVRLYLRAGATLAARLLG